MTAEMVAGLGCAFSEFTKSFDYFFRKPTFDHFSSYCHGLLSDLPRKSVEPIALASGCAVRTLQEFLTHHRWEFGDLRDELQRRIAREHLPTPGIRADEVIGLIDETSVAKKGDKTPGVQRQHCGASGKTDNCIITVHLAVSCGPFRTLIDSDLYLPQETWHEDRDRCRAAHIPAEVVYKAKWQLGIDQITRAISNGIRFDWITFDEDYGGKPQFLSDLDARGQLYIGEVPSNFMCWPSLPKYHSLQSPFRPKRVDNAVRWGKPFRGQPWKRYSLGRQTCAPQTWEVRAAQVWLQRPKTTTSHRCRPTQRIYWLIAARNLSSGEIKYFVSNAPPKTAIKKLLKVAFSRWGVEHVFRVAKSELGLDHYEGRTYCGLMRHMTLCSLMMLFIAVQTTVLRGGKSGAVRIDDGADRASIEYALSPLAASTS
jgi:SRSO17 transposase